MGGPEAQPQEWAGTKGDLSFLNRLAHRRSHAKAVEKRGKPWRMACPAILALARRGVALCNTINPARFRCSVDPPASFAVAHFDQLLAQQFACAMWLRTLNTGVIKFIDYSGSHESGWLTAG